MKLVKLTILDSFLKEVIGGDFTMWLKDDANVLHLIHKVDACRRGRFFIERYPEYRSLLHMTWSPFQENERKYEIFILWGIHRTSNLTGCLPQPTFQGLNVEHKNNLGELNI